MERVKNRETYISQSLMSGAKVQSTAVFATDMEMCHHEADLAPSDYIETDTFRGFCAAEK